MKGAYHFGAQRLLERDPPVYGSMWRESQVKGDIECSGKRGRQVWNFLFHVKQTILGAAPAPEHV